MRDPAASDPEEYVRSPCVRECRLDPATGTCTGCLRTLDEIAGWSTMSADAKRAVLDELPGRRGKGSLFRR